MKKVFYLLNILAILNCGVLFAQEGTFDNSYGTGGKVATPIGGGGQVWGMAMQDDWSVVVGGFVRNGSDSDFALIRYKLNGDIDSGFGINGTVTTAVGNGNDVIYSVAVRSDGKIMAGGLTWNGANYDFAAARYNANGTLDNSFGTTGKVTTAIGLGDDRGSTLGLQSDWSVVIGGSSFNGTNTDFALIRYKPDGTLDSAFGTNGKVITSIGPGNDRINSMVIQPDGKILVAGTTSNGQQHHFALARYNTNGTLDNGFGTSGTVTTFIGTGNDDWAYSLALGLDEKIVVGGYAGNGNNKDFAIVRYLKNGMLDNSFGNYGRVTTAIGSDNESIYGIVVQPDGKIVGAGSYRVGATDNIAMARYNDDGTPDTSFGANGQQLGALSTGNNQAYAVVLQPDGKILTAGYSNNGGNDEFAVARYISGLALGIIDFSVANNSVLIYPNPVQQNATLEYTLSKEEPITIRLLDMQGKTVQTFINNQRQIVGDHIQPLNFADGLAAGPYILSISSPSGSMNIKLVK